MPVVSYYKGGKPINVIAFPEHIFDSSQECMDKLQKALAAMTDIPEDGNIVGACMPIPSQVTPGKAT